MVVGEGPGRHEVEVDVASDDAVVPRELRVIARCSWLVRATLTWPLRARAVPNERRTWIRFIRQRLPRHPIACIGDGSLLLSGRFLLGDRERCIGPAAVRDKILGGDRIGAGVIRQCARRLCPSANANRRKNDTNEASPRLVARRLCRGFDLVPILHPLTGVVFLDGPMDRPHAPRRRLWSAYPQGSPLNRGTPSGEWPDIRPDIRSSPFGGGPILDEATRVRKTETGERRRRPVRRPRRDSPVIDLAKAAEGRSQRPHARVGHPA